jgi:nicotinate phosphoribosyltransferase
VDTYNVERGVRNAIEAGGTGLGAVRIDSGDLGALTFEVREQLNQLGARDTKIVVTSDLDEYAIAALAAFPVDSYGVGTSLVTGSGAPTCGMVYKLVARASSSGIFEGVAKQSSQKSSNAGRKNAGRRLDAEGRAIEEVIVIGSDDAVTNWNPDPDIRPLMVPLVVKGEIDEKFTGQAGVSAAVARHAASRNELPRLARRLTAGEPAIPSVRLDLGGQILDLVY